MDRDRIWRHIDSQRAALADLLSDLDDAEYTTASLCHGWRVREVAAHLTLAQMRPLPATVAVIRARGSFDRMIHDTAVRQATLPVDRYPELLRAMVGSRRKAPVVSDTEPLIDVLVHGQDIAVPLGRSWTVPADAGDAAAERVWRMGFPFSAAKRLAGLRLRSVDSGFDIGEGELVEGPIASLLLVLTGRPAGLVGLTGDGVERIGDRLSGATRATRPPR